jgi:predicted transcriptional regulator
MMSKNELILDEIRKISKMLSLVFGETLEKELSKFCNTDNRKKIWVLIDGKRMTKDIANELGVTARAVDKFLKQMANAGLVENPWGKPPRKIIEYVPPSWLELFERPEEEGKNDE